MLAHTKSHLRLGSITILLAATLWGTSGTAAFFIRGMLSAATIGASTMCGGGLLLFLLSTKNALQIIKTQSKWLLLCGSVAISIYPISFYTGMSIAGVALGNVTAIASAPIFAALLEKILAHKRLNFSRLCISGLIILGIILMIVGNGKFNTAYPSAHGSYFLGIILALISGFMYALYTYISGRIIQTTHNSTASMGALFGLGAILLFPIVFLNIPHLMHRQTIPFMVYLIIAPMFIAYLLFGYGLKYVSAGRATILTLVEPLISVILGVFITQDQLLWYGWLGAIITILGMSLPENFSFCRKSFSNAG